MPSDAEPLGPQPDDPTHRALYEELKLARRFGLNDPSSPLPNLLYVAHIVSTKRDDADKIEDAITKAIARIGGMEAEALTLLMGFTADTRHRPVTYRREQAMRPGGHESYEAFRSRTEPSLLRSVATELSVLVAEQRMAEHLAKTDPESGGSPTSNAEPPSQTESEQRVEAPATPPDTEPPIESVQSQAPPASALSYPARRRTSVVGGVLLSVAAVAVVLVVIASHHGHGVSEGRCGQTTVQLFDPRFSETPENIYIYAPHQEGARGGWVSSAVNPYESHHNEVFRFGEARLLAISYLNTSSHPDRNIIARTAAWQGVSLVRNSACLYRRGIYSSGTRYGVAPLLSQDGLRIGQVAPNESVYLTFKERLPTAASDLTLDRLYGRIGTEEDVAEPEWTREHPYLQLVLTR
jgi:hypothetical protein